MYAFCHMIFVEWIHLQMVTTWSGTDFPSSLFTVVCRGWYYGKTNCWKSSYLLSFTDGTRTDGICLLFFICIQSQFRSWPVSIKVINKIGGLFMKEGWPFKCHDHKSHRRQMQRFRVTWYSFTQLFIILFIVAFPEPILFTNLGPCIQTQTPPFSSILRVMTCFTTYCTSSPFYPFKK